MNLWCKLGFHDWEGFREVVWTAPGAKYPSSWSWDSVCLRCGKLSLDGTREANMVNESYRRRMAGSEERKALVKKLVEGRV